MGLKAPLFGIWSIIIAGPFLVVTFLAARWLRPAAVAGDGGREVPAMYQQNASGIRVTTSVWAFLWSSWLPFSVVIAALTMTGYLVIFFKTGPFAWNGLLAFWMPTVVIGIWSTCLIVLMLRGIQIQAETAHR